MRFYTDSSRRPHPLDPDYSTYSSPSETSAQMDEKMIFNTPPQNYQISITRWLIIINVIVYAIGFFLPYLNQQFLQFGASSGLLVFGRGEYYRLLTAMFLHAGLLHIFFNMYALSILGDSTERLYGRRSFLVVYLLGGLTGSLLSASLGDPRIPSVGASGAVFALLGTQIIYFFRYRRMLGEAGRKTLQNYMFLLFVNLMFGFSIS